MRPCLRTASVKQPSTHDGFTMASPLPTHGVVCLHIADEFEYTDEELVDLLRIGASAHVDFGETAG